MMYLLQLKEFRCMELVSSIAQLVENINRYNEHAEVFAELMPYNRSWYALRAEAGWLLGPSKYIGYQNLSPEEYLGSPYSAERHGRVVQRDKNGMPLDGRVTEGVLRRWSELVEEGHPDYESLHAALNALCARYGKKPNSLARISVIKESREATAATFSDELVTLLAAVFRGLTPAQKSEFRRQIAQA
jgi:hypothetical protein